MEKIGSRLPSGSSRKPLTQKTKTGACKPPLPFASPPVSGILPDGRGKWRMVDRAPICGRAGYATAYFFLAAFRLAGFRAAFFAVFLLAVFLFAADFFAGFFFAADFRFADFRLAGFLALAFFAVVFLRAAAAGIALAFLGSVIVCSFVVEIGSAIAILLDRCLRMK